MKISKIISTLCLCTMVPLSSWALSSDPASLRLEYHRLLTELPKNISIDHPTMSGHSPAILRYQIQKVFDGDPVVSSSMNDQIATEFFERFLLAEGSSVTFEGGCRPIYCLWIQGLDNRRVPPPKDIGIFHPLPIVLTKVYWTFDKTDCKGPVASDGQAAWFSYVEIDNLNPATLQFQTGQLLFFGEGFGLNSPIQIDRCLGRQTGDSIRGLVFGAR